jgi:hypothetical protein
MTANIVFVLVFVPGAQAPSARTGFFAIVIAVAVAGTYREDHGRNKARTSEGPR